MVSWVVFTYLTCSQMKLRHSTYECKSSNLNLTVNKNQIVWLEQVYVIVNDTMKPGCRIIVTPIDTVPLYSEVECSKLK